MKAFQLLNAILISLKKNKNSFDCFGKELDSILGAFYIFSIFWLRARGEKDKAFFAAMLLPIQRAIQRAILRFHSSSDDGVNLK